MDFATADFEFYFTNQDGEDLIPDGANLRVTNGNKREYVQLTARWLVHGRIKKTMGLLVHGFVAVFESPGAVPDSSKFMVCLERIVLTRKLSQCLTLEHQRR